MRNVLVATIAVAVGLAAAPLRAEEGPVVTLKSKDPVYQAIMAALQPAVVESVGQELRIDVREIKTQDEFAFVDAYTVNPDGSAIDFKTTNYADAVTSGMFDGPHLWVYLKLIDGTWTVLEQDIGPTDAWFVYWPEAHGGSCRLTGMVNGC